VDPSLAAITDRDLPALFRAADRSSLDSQKKYLRFVRANLVVVVLAAIVASWADSSPGLRIPLAAVGAAALLTGLALTLFVFQTKPDKNWFGARAVAESVKTLAWRYMSGAEPFGRSLSEADADARFLQQLQEVLRERSAIGAALGGPDSADPQITETMRRIRSLALEERRNVYLVDRIRDQRSWYAGKAAASARSSARWLLAIGVSQLAGAVAAIALIGWPDPAFKTASVFAALAAALIAWLQTRQHRALAQAYGMAAHELGLIESRARHVSSEEEFSSFVADAENAMSREHTMWVARRDVDG
jgi:hypothetical protein